MNAVIFDVDGVLVNVHMSYRLAIKETVCRYLSDFLNIAGDPALLVDDELIDSFKKSGGFNNDWDLTAAILVYYASLVDYKPPALPKEPGTIPGVVEYLSTISSGLLLDVDTLLLERDLPLLFTFLTVNGTGLENLSPEKVKDIVWYRDEIDTRNLVKRYFQELYLGSESFEKNYGFEAILAPGPGLYRTETPFIAPETIKTLGASYSLGLATGREDFEVDLVLENLDLKGVFGARYTETDSARESALSGENLRKPHPRPIIAVHNVLCGEKGGRSVYVGDLPDDVLAANRAKDSVDIISIGCLQTTNDSTGRTRLAGEFKEAGADYIIESVNDLPALLSGIWGEK